MSFPEHLKDIPIFNGLHKQLNSIQSVGSDYRYSVVTSDYEDVSTFTYGNIVVTYTMNVILDSYYATVKKNGVSVKIISDTTIRDLIRSNIKSANK